MAAYLSQSGLKNSDRRVKPVDTRAAVDKAVVDKRRLTIRFSLSNVVID